ncbi:MAG TPA: IS30 family transposase [Legionella sp.]|nr:IS30 family transposase [Legionella sp.]
MLGYKHLNYLKRCKIMAFWKAGYTQVDIAKEVGVSQSTISRELNRNITFVRTKLGSWQYKPDYAQANADRRHKEKNKKIKLTPEIANFIREKILQKWSPDQISGYAKKHQLFSIGKEWIYQFILKDKVMGGKLYLNMRHQNKKYRKRYGSPKRTGPIKNRRFIEERPKIVDEKNRIGDWEIDTIIGKQQKQAVVSIVERFSKKTILRKVSNRTANMVSTVTIESLKKISGTVLSITLDNGSEFAFHEKISQELNTDFYFAHPYSSWERGVNENTNGLVRQYLKKGSSFSNVTDIQLEMIANDLNNRPRKKLGYATPNEIFNQILI